MVPVGEQFSYHLPLREMMTTETDTGERKSALKPLPEPPAPEMVPDWHDIGLFTTGIAVGAVLGAAVALLVAPRSGEEFRSRVARRFGRGSEKQSVWDELADELKKAALD